MSIAKLTYPKCSYLKYKNEAEKLQTDLNPTPNNSKRCYSSCMLDYKNIFSIIAILIGVASRIEYISLILRKKIKPHAFSWLIWSILTSIAFAAQLTEKGGAGSWVTGFTAAACFAIFVLALIYGERKYSYTDWASLAGSGVAMILWWLTSGPLFAVILVSIIDIIGFVPTFKKGFKKPFEDSVTIFWVSNISFILSLMAMENHNLTTWLYPVTIIVTNSTFVIMIILRRKLYKKTRGAPVQ